jgi:hypothetical protein
MTSEEIIRRARERWEEIDNEGLDWRSFANGWLEGRIDLMKELDEKMSSKLTKKLDND